MGKINIDYGQARSEINGIQNQINSSLQAAKGQVSQLQNYLNESEGAFVEALKEQFQAESDIILASEAFFSELCSSLLQAVATYEEQDKKISGSLDQIIS